MPSIQQIVAWLTAERLTAGLVYLVGAIVGVYAQKGMSPVQWAGAALAVSAAVLAAVIARTWPKAVVAAE